MSNGTEQPDKSTGAGNVSIQRDANQSFINTGVITINVGVTGQPIHVDLSAVIHRSEAARQSLEPRILPRVPRAIVREQYLPKLRESLVGGAPKIIFLIGPAGYGKSTILGNIYDEILASQLEWVLLVRCNDLTAL